MLIKDIVQGALLQPKASSSALSKPLKKDGSSKIRKRESRDPIVVGLVVFIIITVLVTNPIRCRHAQRFDKDVAEATQEETTAAHASPPNFRDFDDEDYIYGSSGGGGGGSEGSGGGRSYMDTTHYTTHTTSSGVDALYNQSPMQPAEYESYGMAELPVAAGVGAGAGAAAGCGTALMYPGGPVADPWNTTTTNANGNTAGVGTAGLNTARSTTTPYNTFAEPPPVQSYANVPPVPDSQDLFHDAAGVPVGGFYNPMPQPQPYGAGAGVLGGAEASILAAAGLGGAGVGAAAVTTARSQGTLHRRSRSGQGHGSAENENDETAVERTGSAFPIVVPIPSSSEQTQVVTSVTQVATVTPAQSLLSPQLITFICQHRSSPPRPFHSQPPPLALNECKRDILRDAYFTRQQLHQTASLYETLVGEKTTRQLCGHTRREEPQQFRSGQLGRLWRRGDGAHWILQTSILCRVLLLADVIIASQLLWLSIIPPCNPQDCAETKRNGWQLWAVAEPILPPPMAAPVTLVSTNRNVSTPLASALASNNSLSSTVGSAPSLSSISSVTSASTLASAP
ncbi:hypothetical protein BC629DRAFT_1596707 [Irpex lacteus]|nr:hypothetical protein BC629DRAFT_1596707 [Irpex lacteus]